MATKDFEPLALDGANYPTCAMDLKIKLTTRGLQRVIFDPPDDQIPSDIVKYFVLSIIRNHIHLDLKAEYLYEENPLTLWLALKNRYEQQKVVILPEANHKLAHLRLQDFKSVGDYNHALHTICSKLRFCEKEPTDADKIEKTLSTMLPSDMVLQQQWRAANYQTYFDLMHTLLQAEKHAELLLKNNQQRPIGAALLPEVHTNQNNNKFSGSKDHSKNFKGKHKCNKKQKPSGFKKGKAILVRELTKLKFVKSVVATTILPRNAAPPKHLVNLYLQSLAQGKNAQEKIFEAHFNLTSNNEEAGCSQKFLQELKDTCASTKDDLMCIEDTLEEFHSLDMFGDLN